MRKSARNPPVNKIKVSDPIVYEKLSFHHSFPLVIAANS